jgi:hypothetical protein
MTLPPTGAIGRPNIHTTANNPMTTRNDTNMTPNHDTELNTQISDATSTWPSYFRYNHVYSAFSYFRYNHVYSAFSYFRYNHVYSAFSYFQIQPRVFGLLFHGAGRLDHRIVHPSLQGATLPLLALPECPLVCDATRPPRANPANPRPSRPFPLALVLVERGEL